jgi:hypothetical protein
VEAIEKAALIHQDLFYVCLAQVIYQPYITASPFRKCNEKNLGMTDLCSVFSLKPKPQIWATDVRRSFKSKYF